MAEIAAMTFEDAKHVEHETIVAGGGYLDSIQIATALTPWMCRIVHAKAARRVAAIHPGCHVWVTELIAAFGVSTARLGRFDGLPMRQCVEWTGARGRWQRRMNKAAVQAEAIGAISQFPWGRGFRFILNRKGEQILRDYDNAYISIGSVLVQQINQFKT